MNVFVCPPREAARPRETKRFQAALGALISAAGLVVGLGLAALGVPGTVAGIGLLKRKAWAKVWTIVVAALNLLNVPVGTAFGIYAIWVVTRPEADAALS